MGIRRRDLARRALRRLVKQYEKDPKPARFTIDDDCEGVSEFDLAYAAEAISRHEYEMLVSGVTVYRREYEAKVHALTDEMVSRGWIRKGPLMWGKGRIEPPHQVILTPKGIDAVKDFAWYHGVWRKIRTNSLLIILSAVGSLLASAIWWWLRNRH